jgi:hypothetical protein
MVLVTRWKDRPKLKALKVGIVKQQLVLFIIPPKREAAEVFNAWLRKQAILAGKQVNAPDIVLYKLVTQHTKTLGKREAAKIYYPKGESELLYKILKLYREQIGKAPECFSYKP